jgi:hypothetical protein
MYISCHFKLGKKSHKPQSWKSSITKHQEDGFSATVESINGVSSEMFGLNDP